MSSRSKKKNIYRGELKKHAKTLIDGTYTGNNRSVLTQYLTKAVNIKDINKLIKGFET